MSAATGARPASSSSTTAQTPFQQGFARGLRHGKLVYYDRALRPVIVTGYDWGYPFEHGRAEVCTGCTDKQLDDEHHAMVGGRWAVIDRKGRVVAARAGALHRP